MNQPANEYAHGTDAPCTHRYLWEPVVEALARHAKGKKILDAGCGNGRFSHHLIQQGYEVWGIDQSTSGIEHARQHAPDGQFAQGSIYDDLTQLWPDQPTFDAVVSLEVVEHLFSPQTFVRRLAELTEPGTPLILSTPYHGFLKNLVLAATNHFDQHFTALWEGGHIKFWSQASLTTLIEQQPFEVIDFIGAGRMRYLWKSMVLVARRIDGDPNPIVSTRGKAK